MRFQLSVTYVDGTTEVTTVGTADQVAFELHFDRPITSLAEEFRLSDACWLTWQSLKRTSGLDVPFEKWLETVEEVTAAQDDLVPLETSQPIG